MAPVGGRRHDMPSRQRLVATNLPADASRTATRTRPIVEQSRSNPPATVAHSVDRMGRARTVKLASAFHDRTAVALEAMRRFDAPTVIIRRDALAFMK